MPTRAKRRDNSQIKQTCRPQPAAGVFVPFLLFEKGKGRKEAARWQKAGRKR